MGCKHERYSSTVKLQYVELKVRDDVERRELFAFVSLFCAECKEPYILKGAEGWATNQPMLSEDHTSIRIPLIAPIRGYEEPAGPN